MTNAIISTLEVNSKNYLFAATNGEGIYRSTNNGKNWTPINNGLVDYSILPLAINKNDVIFGGTNEGRIYSSTNDGDNWNEVKQFQDSYIYSLTINSNNNIFAAVWNYNILKGQVFYSTDSGKNWLSFNDGLPGTGINSLAINSNGYIFAGTSGNSVFRSVNSTTSVNDEKSIPSTFSLAQNYPNPFNPSTTILYKIPKTGLVSLKVYDILGREIKTLVNEEKPAGSYEVKFDRNRLSSGIYFYRLRVGENSSVKKMILLK